MRNGTAIKRVANRELKKVEAERRGRKKKILCVRVSIQIHIGKWVARNLELLIFFYNDMNAFNARENCNNTDMAKYVSTMLWIYVWRHVQNTVLFFNPMNELIVSTQFVRWSNIVYMRLFLPIAQELSQGAFDVEKVDFLRELFWF